MESGKCPVVVRNCVRWWVVIRLFPKNRSYCGLESHILATSTILINAEITIMNTVANLPYHPHTVLNPILWSSQDCFLARGTLRYFAEKRLWCLAPWTFIRRIRESSENGHIHYKLIRSKKFWTIISTVILINTYYNFQQMVLSHVYQNIRVHLTRFLKKICLNHKSYRI